MLSEQDADPWAADDPWTSRETCFIAMPITTTEEQAKEYGDSAHWRHVMDELFVPAIEAAGYEPVLPVTRGSYLIHGVIVKQLSEADMVLVDLSSHNPNVFFELGVRTSLNKPVALVRSEGTTIPFDTSGINTHSYKPQLRPWNVKEEIETLARHISDAKTSCAGENPMWRQFGLTIKAEEPSSEGSREDAMLELIADSVENLRRELSGPAMSREPTSGEELLAFLNSDRSPFIDEAGSSMTRAMPSIPREEAQARIQAIAANRDVPVEIYFDNRAVDVVYQYPERDTPRSTTAFRKEVKAALRGTGWDPSFNSHRISIPRPEVEDGG